jgi:hypothetical protein
MYMRKFNKFSISVNNLDQEYKLMTIPSKHGLEESGKLVEILNIIYIQDTW